MVKKLYPFLVLLLAAPLFAETVQTTVVGPFGCINNTDNSMIIGNDKAQDLLNVDIFPGGKSVKRRKGYATSATLSITTGTVHGIYTFYDSNANAIDLYFNDKYMSASVGGGTPSVIFSSGPLSATYQCADSQGFAYCTNSSRTNLVKTNGATYSLINNVVSTGTMVAVTPNRLVEAGFSEAPNRIDFSKSQDFTTWLTAATPTDPINFTITAPGSKITHITYAFNRLMWFKDQSFGYILEGATQGDWQVRTISPNLGTLDNTSVYWQDLLYFKGQDGHYYVYDGTTIQKLSRDIGGTIAQAQGRTLNSWTQTTQSDFGTGFSTPSASVDTTTVLGVVQLQLTPESVWRDGSASNSTGQCGSSPYYSSKQFALSSSILLSAVTLIVGETGSPSGSIIVSLMSDSSDTPGSVLVSSTIAMSVITSSSQTIKVTFSPQIGLTSGTKYWIQFAADTCSSKNVYWWQQSAGDSSYKTAQSSIISNQFAATFIYKVHGSTYAATGTYQSAVKNAPSLSVWDSFQTTNLGTGGSNSFFIRSASNSFTAGSSTPAWTSISNGAVPTISTNVFFQIRDVLLTSVSTTTPVLYDFTQNWFEGSAVDKSYATYFKDAIWWSSTVGAGQSTNNRIVRYDLLNQGWNLYDLTSNGFLTRNNALYFGSSSSGFVYKFGDNDNDNGAAINAYWKSKDFFGSSPFLDKELNTLSVSAASVANSSMTITYTMNGSSSTAYTMPQYKSTSSFTKFNKQIPTGKIGSNFNIQFGNNAIDQPFECFGVEVTYREKPWNASQ